MNHIFNDENIKVLLFVVSLPTKKTLIANLS